MHLHEGTGAHALPCMPVGPLFILALFLAASTCSCGKQKPPAGATPPPTVAQLICTADVLALHGEVAEAARLLEKALQVEPGNLVAMAALAAVRTDAGDLDGARQMIRGAIRRAPDAPGLYEIRSGLRGCLLDTAGQRADLKKAASLAGDAARYQYQYAAATCHLAAGHLRAADEMLVPLARTGKWPAATKRLQASVAFLGCRYDDFITHTNELIASGHETANIHFERGVVQSTPETRADAVRSLRRAIKLDPGHGLARLYFAAMLAEDGKSEEAAEHAAAAERAGYSFAKVRLRTFEE